MTGARLSKRASAARPLRFLAPAVLAAALACGGRDQPAGTIVGAARPPEVQAAAGRAQAQAESALAVRSGAKPTRQGERILFGDLHVHTTYSIDAFMFSLPLFAGEGAHPPADLCDFARYCSSLDFFALTDHSESLTAEHWQAEKESIRQCNAKTDPSDPDLVAFMGFEWTQVGRSPETHYGHRCVIFPGTADDELPARPINALPDQGPDLFAGIGAIRGVRWIDPLGLPEYQDFLWLLDRLSKTPRCPRGVDTRQLPPDCLESAPTPDVLYEKLAQWGFDAFAIPHGTSWGLYTPPGTSMDKQLTRASYDPARAPLIEIMSGHGNSEEFRPWHEVEFDAAGRAVCPAPTADYEPCCWRAGEIMRGRCGDLPAEECARRVEEAKRLYTEANVSGHLVFPGAGPDEWGDCGQCRDCFKPPLSMRPRESVQYSMALSNFGERDAAGRPLRFRYGFVASSDNHKARPGTGYKQYDRREMTESSGVRAAYFDRFSARRRLARQADPRTPQTLPTELGGLLAADTERVSSFLYPGGLVAVHANGRDRGAIWEALRRREVYATSGPRILLWFDLLNAPGGPAPMGSAVELTSSPSFEVRAVGSFVQKPGCPDTSVRGLPPDRLARLCRGECWNPSDQRHPIVAIEIVRIRPQAKPGEPIAPLIEDPWRRFDCVPDPAGCVVRFDDPEWRLAGRDALYYARALQEETPAINGANLRTTFDREGRAVATKPCSGDYRTAFDDDCLAPVRERAWSSPIFVDQPAGGALAGAASADGG